MSLCCDWFLSNQVKIPARSGFDEEDVEVVCDKAFIDAIKLAVGSVDGKMMK